MNTRQTTNEDEKTKVKAFVSYSRKDKAFIDRLDEALKARGIEPLIDRGEAHAFRDSLIGRNEVYMFHDSWQRIQDLITQADAFIFVLSPNAVASNLCAREADFASSLQKRIVPLVYQICDSGAVPVPLRRLKFIFSDDETYFETAMDDLTRALSADIDWIKKHTEFGAQARLWSMTRSPKQSAGLLCSGTLEEAERWIAVCPQGAPQPTTTTRAFIIESRRVAMQRRRVLTAGLSAGLIFAMGLVGLAYLHRDVAVEQRDIVSW